MYQVNIHEAKTHFSKLLRDVQNGNEVIIAKGNKPIAKLVSIQKSNRKRKIGTAKGKVRIADDFDAPLDDFKDYM
jgi:prevent-host-death family protein